MQLPYFSPGTQFALGYILKGFAEDDFTDVVSSYEKYTNHYFFHPAFENEIPVPQSDIVNALSFLDNQNILISEETITRYCVDCFSLNVELTQKCPSCGSLDVLFGKTITHKCGYRDIEGAFGNPDKLICPRCKEGIYSIYSDCKIGDPTFVCRTCKSYFDVATPVYVCKDCNRIYKSGEEPYVRIKRYEPAPLLAAIKQDIMSTFLLLEALCSYLEKKGLDVRRNAILDQGEIITYWNALLLRKESKEKFALMALAPVFQLDEDMIDMLVNSKKAAKLDGLLVIYANALADAQPNSFTNERIYFVNPRQTKFDVESELVKTAAPLVG
jgi:Zn finger protein HypA/HybF involved in hydrogenase expression